jgi:archaellum component FlaC
MENSTFELLTKLYSEMTGRFDKMEKDISGVKDELSGVKNEVLMINMRIEHDIMPKLEVLFDGYKQNTEQLSRIEVEVTKHEEVILRRIK